MSQMSSQFATQVDQEVVGEPMQVGAYTLQPLARAQGKIWRSPEGEGQGQAEGVFMQLSPTAVRITDQQGAENLLVIPPSDNSPFLGMAAGAAATAVVSILIMLVTQLLSRR